MKLDVTLPAEYAAGTVHQEGLRNLGRNVTFEVVGWYINHHKEPGVMRYIKDGNALAIREVDPSVLLKKKEEQKRATSRIQIVKPARRVTPIPRLKGKPIGGPLKRVKAAAIEGLIKIGLLTPDEATKIFGPKEDPRVPRKVPKVIDLLNMDHSKPDDPFD